MADMAIDLAKNPRPQVRELKWEDLFAGSRHSAQMVGGAAVLGSGSPPPVEAPTGAPAAQPVAGSGSASSARPAVDPGDAPDAVVRAEAEEGHA
jgi:hypothetical protein